MVALFVGSSMQTTDPLPQLNGKASSNKEQKKCQSCNKNEASKPSPLTTSKINSNKKGKASKSSRVLNINEIADDLQVSMTGFEYGNYDNYQNLADNWEKIKGLSEKELHELYATLDESSEKGINRNTSTMLYARMAQLNPITTLEHIQEHKKNDALYTVFNSWSKTDPMAALNWISDNDDKLPANYRFESQIFKKLAENDPTTALEEFGKLDKARMSSALQGILQTVKSTEEFKSLANIMALKEGSDRHLQSILYSWSRKNAIEALDYTESIDNKKQKEQAIKKIKHGWMREKPEEASKWIMANTEDKAKGLQEVVNGWSWKDGTKALNFIETQEVENKDKAYEAYVSRFSWSDPKSATNALDYIDDPKMRKRAVQRLYSTLRHKSNATAQEFLESRNEFTAEEKENMSKAKRH
jgi:hypothetical protein